MKLRCWSALLLLGLSACSSVKVTGPAVENQAAYTARTAQLGRIQVWGLVGRISLDDGKQGGSGSLRWDVRPGKSELDFHGAMGRGAWHLLIGPGTAVLREASGEEHRAADVNVLIQEWLEWPIPFDALQWWVRGLAAPGDIDALKLDANGRVVSLSQAGWQVQFNRYVATGGGGVLPLRLDARRDNYRVKLAVRRWRVGSADEPEG